MTFNLMKRHTPHQQLNAATASRLLTAFRLNRHLTTNQATATPHPTINRPTLIRTTIRLPRTTTLLPTFHHTTTHQLLPMMLTAMSMLVMQPLLMTNII